jgi:ribose/xylose/arabinose/galactoside ABC-type transport system permease subunit
MTENRMLQAASTFLRRYWMLIAYAGMIAVFTAIRPQYLSVSNIRSILIQVAMLGIIASGMTLVVLTGGADFSVGAVAGVSALAGMWPVVFHQLPLPYGVLIAMGVALAFGVANGVAVSRLGVAPFVATLGTLFLAQGLQYLVSDGGMSISYGFPAAYTFIGTGSAGPVPMPIAIYIVVFLTLFIVTEYSPVGRYIRATGLNQFASERSGIPIRFYTFSAYVVSALLAATVGLILGASQSYVSPDHGASFLLDSLLVVLLGKTLLNDRMSMQSTALGALFLRSFETGLSMVGTPMTIMSVLKGSLLVAVLLLTIVKRTRAGRAQHSQ